MLLSYVCYLFSVVLTFSAVVWGAPLGAGKNLIARDGAHLMGSIAGTKAPGMLNDRHGADRTLAPNKAAGIFKKAESGLHSLAEASRGQTDSRGILGDIAQLWKCIFESALEEIRKAIEKGTEISDRTLGRLKEAIEKLKTFGIDMTEEVKALIETFSEKGKEDFQKILEKLAINAE
ncbi:hypothetical protein RSOLAG22IIIB_13208 [Rhizoctonia solani]|uniref:Secreted protein n=1 Tax=Rhizoctonia solani TaxID=456999 RepID=A0A0K6GJA8_9AGAM|nr:hypothetical protein RSOLAG22IIIB_13208 [Rhizoctonia solani]